MIESRQGNILEDPADALVNTVNCVGVMGRGLALQFKRQFPDNFKAYKKACEAGAVEPGKMFIFDMNSLHPPHYIINFPTKRHWRNDSRMGDIKLGLADLRRQIAELSQQVPAVRSVAVPPLGSHLGRLDWQQVKPLIEEALRDLDIEVRIYDPLPQDCLPPLASHDTEPAMTAGRAALVALMDGYLKACLDVSITLLEVQKLMYFLQTAGEPLRLRYSKQDYGPYADNLRHLLQHIEGHFVSGYGDGGDKPGKALALVPGTLDRARACLEHSPETKARIDRVLQLAEGFETGFGLELLASVHWIAREQASAGPEQILTALHRWNDRKKIFDAHHVAVAHAHLQDTGWLKQGLAGSASRAMAG